LQKKMQQLNIFLTELKKWNLQLKLSKENCTILREKKEVIDNNDVYDEKIKSMETKIHILGSDFVITVIRNSCQAVKKIKRKKKIMLENRILLKVNYVN
jgi:hypothetical protein